ncbi:MAG: hypothetical protein D6786_09110 [Gammaproteobacteria bacterium]|nr:MAG: hypothetical protein D6786_09110 [Gammaproteobacteria bacterium]
MALRDNQRSRVYRAEEAVDWQALGADLPLELAAARELVDRTTSSDWWRARFPGAATRVPVRDGRGRRRAGAGPDFITLPRWSRRPWIVCHELAHVAVVPLLPHIEPHGREFCRAYLDLVGRQWGAEARQALAAAFAAGGVRTGGRDLEAWEARRRRAGARPGQRPAGILAWLRGR